MKKFAIRLSKKLDTMYTLYERYAWNHENTIISVIIQDNSISFYLNDSNKVEDELILSFDDDDRILYPYMALEVLVIVLGNVYVHRDKNILFNNAHRPYVKMYVNDNNILDLMMPIINNQNKEFIHKNMEYIQIQASNLSGYKVDNDFLDELDSRIDIIKKVLRKY